MLKEGGKDQATRLFGEIGRLVEISIEGRQYRVPEKLELLRCYQYLGFQIAYERFCWNGNCGNCIGEVVEGAGGSGGPIRSCQVPAAEGMTVKHLPEGVRARFARES
jgi:NADH dehydrogenase/NADH:ubiquinone oxidoreductase subunit G